MLIKDISLLTACKLWQGSMFEIDNQYGGIQLASLKKKADELNSCDDLTKKEKEWLVAIEETIKIHSKI